MALISKSLTVWLVILFCAVANGALRESVLISHLGKAPGLLLSGVLLSALILVITFLALPWLGAHRPAQLMGFGAFWVALTLAFELSFGRFQGKTWATILEAYTFKDGNIWPVVLLVTAVAPYAAARLRGLQS